MLQIFMDMFKYAYNLDTEHLVIKMITSMLNFIGYLTLFGICFDRPISNMAGLSLFVLYIDLYVFDDFNLKAHSSNDMSTCDLPHVKEPVINGRDKSGKIVQKNSLRGKFREF